VVAVTPVASTTTASSLTNITRRFQTGSCQLTVRNSGHFGKVGMRTFHMKKNPDFCPVANVDKLWHLVGEETLKAAKAGKFGDKAPVIDMTDYGVFKLLGKGRLPEVPVVVKARFFSALAEKKIKAAGGACILTA